VTAEPEQGLEGGHRRAAPVEAEDVLVEVVGGDATWALGAWGWS